MAQGCVRGPVAVVWQHFLSPNTGHSAGTQGEGGGGEVRGGGKECLYHSSGALSHESSRRRKNLPSSLWLGAVVVVTCGHLFTDILTCFDYDPVVPPVPKGTLLVEW